MNDLLRELLITIGVCAAGLALLALALTIVPRLPGIGRRFVQIAARPLLA